MTRSSLVFLAIVVAAMVLSAGCRGRGRTGRPGPGGTDSGMIAFDSGPRPDSGITLMPDSGTPPRDSGGPPPECVSDTDCVSSEMCSAGACVPRMMCPSNIVTTITTQVCADATRTCVEGCTDGTCLVACLEADPDPSCLGCANNNILACFNRNGCQSQWNCLIECVELMCPDDFACVDTTCRTQNEAYNGCTDTVPDSAECGGEWTPCVGL